MTLTYQLVRTRAKDAARANSPGRLDRTLTGQVRDSRAQEKREKSFSLTASSYVCTYISVSGRLHLKELDVTRVSIMARRQDVSVQKTWPITAAGCLDLEINNNYSNPQLRWAKPRGSSFSKWHKTALIHALTEALVSAHVP